MSTATTAAPRAAAARPTGVRVAPRRLVICRGDAAVRRAPRGRWLSSNSTTLRPTSCAPAMPGKAAAPGRGRPVAASGRLRARRSANVVPPAPRPWICTRVDVRGSPCLLRFAPLLRFGWPRRESAGLDRGLSCSACGCGGCCIGHRCLQRAGGRLERQHRSHPVAGRWSHGCPAAASHWKDDFARVFGQRKSEVGQRRPPAARFGRSWSAGVFARVHGQGAPSGMGLIVK